jgi:hypothetical protein
VPPSAAQCAATPGLAGCAADVPATNAGSNAAPVLQVSNTYIIAINTESSTLLAGGSSTSGDSPSSSGGEGAPSTGGTKTTSNTGTTNEPAKKLYCN